MEVEVKVNIFSWNTILWKCIYTDMLSFIIPNRLIIGQTQFYWQGSSILRELASSFVWLLMGPDEGCSLIWILIEAWSFPIIGMTGQQHPLMQQVSTEVKMIRMMFAILAKILKTPKAILWTVALPYLNFSDIIINKFGA